MNGREALSERLNVRVTVEELWQLDRAARELRMTRTELVRRLLLAYLAGTAATLALALAPAPARADAALELARLCAHEAGWDGAADCRAIGAVVVGLAERNAWTPARAVRALAPRLARCAVSRRWACALDARGREPRGWPAGLAWSSVRARWLNLLQVARAALAAGPVGPCVEAPRTWGSASDWRRALALGRRLRPVDCGPTANQFGAW